MGTITTPTDLSVTPEGGFLLPPVEVDPLRAALRNANHLWENYTPPAVSFIPLDGPLSRSTTHYVVPVVPSADSISYYVLHILHPETTGTVDIAIDENTGLDPSTGWTTIYGPTTTGSLAGDEWTTAVTLATISAAARMLRITYSGMSGTGDLLVSHVLAVPAPGAPSAGLQPSGFAPFDEDLLSATNGPVATEMLDRAQANAFALLQDRVQVVASLVQPYDAAPGWLGLAAPVAGAPTGVPMRLGAAVAHLPWQAKAKLHIHVLAFVSSGSDADLVEVQVGDQSVRFDASGQLETAELTVKLTGVVDAALPVTVRVRATFGESTYCAAVVVTWRPGEQ